MKNIKILLLLLSLTACNNKTKTISTLDLEKTIIDYKDLPSKVKERVFYGEAMKLGEEDEERFQDFQETNNPKKYEYYTKQNPQLAWVHYPYIRNKKQSKNILLIKMAQWEVDTLFMEILYTFQIIIISMKKIV